MPTVHFSSITKTPNETASTLQKETDSANDHEIAPLGEPSTGRRLWFQKGRKYDPDAIATQPSVYDDPNTAHEYQPNDDWENLHRFDPSARWTWSEENRVIRKIDVRIMIFTSIMFMALELDRANLQQALTDNFLKDLNLTTNDYNLGNTVFKLSFLCAELPSQLVSKWMGPDRWIPTQMTLWSAVGMAQYGLKGRSSFLACRALLGMLQGGFIPDDLAKLPTGREARKAGSHHGESLLRYISPWPSNITLPSEETIMVNRVIRDDPSKGTMHNREPITPKLLWKSLCDYDLWPLYAIGLTWLTPMTPPHQYLTLNLRGMGFNTFVTNLLTIPCTFAQIPTMITLTYLSEKFGQLTWAAMFPQFWALPFVIYLYVVDINSIIAWNSRNSNTVRSRTVSAAVYNMCVQASGIIASNIYRKDDAPRYKRGNRVLVALVAMNISIYLFTKAYYVWRNAYRDRKWNSMSGEEKRVYLATTTDEGNKRLDFRFAH
ncbi:hypothetical protein APSETT445_006556 [Aspergillus pseudonomiae]